MVDAPAIYYDQVWRDVGFLAPPTPQPEEPPPIGELPTRQQIIDGAGLLTPVEELTPASGKIILDTPDEVVEGLDIAGIVELKAPGVVLRDCRVHAYTTSIIVRADAGVPGMRVEHCQIECDTNLAGDKGPAGGVGALGGGTGLYVGYCDISGFADGIKADGGSSVYERNYIHMHKPSGSTKHLDAIQGSGDSHFTVRQNVIDANIEAGGNACVLAQAWTGQANVFTYDVRIVENYLTGGNFTLYVIGGKSNQPLPPGAASYLDLILDCEIRDNRFEFDDPAPRYGWMNVNNDGSHAIAGNTFMDGTTPVNPGDTV